MWLELFASFCSSLQVKGESEIVCLLHILREVSGFIYPPLSLYLTLLSLLIHTKILMTQSGLPAFLKHSLNTSAGQGGITGLLL